MVQACGWSAPPRAKGVRGGGLVAAEAAQGRRSAYFFVTPQKTGTVVGRSPSTRSR